MSAQQVKKILILYRPGTVDGGDPEVAQALALIKKDQKLSHWFANNCAIREALREKFRQIPVPLDSLQKLKARLSQKSASVVRTHNDKYEHLHLRMQAGNQ